MINEYKTSVKKVDNEEKMSGMAIFTGDIRMDNALFAIPVRSTVSHGKILKINVPSLPKGYYFISAKDIVKENVCNIIASDWPVFADKEVNYKGEIIGLIIGRKKLTCLSLAKDVHVEYEELEPVYEMKNSYVHKEFNKGNTEVFKNAKKVFSESFETGYQEHIYLEPQGMLMWLDGNKITIKASMQ